MDAVKVQNISIATDSFLATPTSLPPKPLLTLATTNLVFFSNFVLSRLFYKWNHTVCTLLGPTFFLFLFLKKFYWSIIDLQCC